MAVTDDEALFVSFLDEDDEDSYELVDINEPYEAKRREGWWGLIEQDLTEVQADVGGYGLALGLRSSAQKEWVPAASRPRRKKVRQRDGSSVVETVALTKEEWQRRELRVERDTLMAQELVGLSSARAQRFLWHLVKNKIDPRRPLRADDPKQQGALDEAVEALHRLNAAWTLITPRCETPNCPRPAEHHSVPKVRPKVHRESCTPCNHYFRNHQAWPTYVEAQKDNQ